MSDPARTRPDPSYRRFFSIGENGEEIEEFGWGEEEEVPEVFGPEDVRVDVTIRITTGEGSIDEQTRTLTLPGLLNPSQLESSEATVAEAIGTELVEPIRARMRAELFSRANRLPTSWLEGDPELVDWYDTIRRAGIRTQRVDDKVQWSRIACGGRSLSDLLSEAAESDFIRSLSKL